MKVFSMKKLAITQFSILTFVSGVVAVLTLFTGRLVAYHWNEILGDGVALPAVTDFTTHYGFLIPLICCLSSKIFVAVSMKRPDDLPPLWGLFTLIVTIELISLALIAFFGMLPVIHICVFM